MTGTAKKESPAERLRRIVQETGLVGLGVRGAARSGFAVSAAMEHLAKTLIAATPPSLLTSPRDRKRLQRNLALKDRHAGKRCFILGNGPSLRDENLSLLNDAILLTVNQGHRFAEAHGLKPAYHAAVDPLFADEAFDHVLQDWADFQKATDAALLLTVELADRFAQLGLDVDHFAVKQYMQSVYFDDLSRPVPVALHYVQPGYLSVIHFAIVAALYMGFTDIRLLGCDMDFYLQPDSPFLHSYDDPSSPTIRDGAGKVFGWDQVDLTEWCLKEFRAFRNLGILAQSRGAQIVNAGAGGALNVFPRAPLTRRLEEKVTWS